MREGMGMIMKLAGVGHANIDLLVSVERMPESGERPHILSVSWQGGGPIATALAALGRLGGSGCAFCTTGGCGGRFIREDLERHNVDCRGIVQIPEKDSWMYMCLSDTEKNGRSFVDLRTENSAPHILPEQLDTELLFSCDWLLICDESPAARWVLAQFHARDKTIVIDADGINDLHKILPKIHHSIMSEDLYKRLFGANENYEANLRQLHALQPEGRSVTVVTLGEKGCALIDENGAFSRLPAYPVKALDTTGAGDVFHGAYVAGRFEGLSAVEACRQASAVSALKCLCPGGRAGLPTKAVVQHFMRTGEIHTTESRQRTNFYQKMPFDL